MNTPIRTSDTTGTVAYYLNGELHREDGPAIEMKDGRKAYYLNGLRHRIDGPAIEYLDVYKKWWLNDVELTEEEHTRLVNLPEDELIILTLTTGKQYGL
jgi:hypothetical protein